MVVSTLRMIGVDTAGASESFSGVCCRMGGLTVATVTKAGVPENILWMQTSHAQDRAARRYVHLTNPSDSHYDTWRAFQVRLSSCQ